MYFSIVKQAVALYGFSHHQKPRKLIYAFNKQSYTILKEGLRGFLS